ncbi:MAG: hypothetical protein ACLUR5_07585 [Eubacterium ventriosum]
MTRVAKNYDYTRLCANVIIRGKVSMHVEMWRSYKGGIKKYVAKPNAGGETKFIKVFRRNSGYIALKISSLMQ